MTYNNFPQQLREQKQWVLWKKEKVGEKITKVPYKNTAQKAASTNPEDWLSFEETKNFLEKFPNQFDGIGYVFKEGVIGIDLDHCFDEFEQLKPWAKEIVELFPSYVELSPSGNGLHIFLLSQVDFKGAKTYIYNNIEVIDGDIERYCNGRYFTVTGKVYGEYNTLKTYEPEYFLNWHNSLIKEKQIETSNLTYDDLVPEDKKILEVAFKSKNGKKLSDLYNGDWKQYFDSQSEADMSLVGMLSFFCRNNPVVIDRIFRTSGLMRDKWERNDYRDEMIKKCYSLEVMDWNKDKQKQETSEQKDRKITAVNELLGMTPNSNPFILQGMIVEGSVNALTSDSGKGKSLLALKAVEAIVKGEKFLGEFPTKQSKTLIIDLEMSQDDLIERTQSIIHDKMDGLDFYHCQSFNICDDNDYNWLKDIIAKNGYKLIVLDTFSMAHNKNENDNSEVNIVNHRLLNLINECNITILFLHHHRKLAKGEQMSQSSSRGATDIIGKTASHLLLDTRDIMVALGEEGEQKVMLKGIRIVVEQMKRRRATGFDIFAVKVWYNPETRQTSFLFDGFDEKAENATDKTKTLLLSKLEVGEEYTRKDMQALVGKSSNLSNAIKELIEQDKILGFRMPIEDEQGENGKSIPRNTKIYYLTSETPKMPVQAVQKLV